MTSEVSLIPLKTDQPMAGSSDEPVAGHSILKSGIVSVGESGMDEVFCGDCSMGDQGLLDFEKNIGKTHTEEGRKGILISEFTTKCGKCAMGPSQNHSGDGRRKGSQRKQAVL